MFQQFDLGVFLLAVLPVLLAITVHEAAHGYAARYWGHSHSRAIRQAHAQSFGHILI